jgi:hypothetical protein
MIKEIKLKLNKKQRTFTFGLIYLGEVLERLDIDYNSLLNKVSKNPFKYAPILMFESLRNTYRINKESVDFTEDDLVNWLEKEDLLGVDLMLKFVHAFMGTNENPTPVEVNNSDDVKKK